MPKESNKRIYYLDILRVIACLAIIMIHTSSRFVIKDFGSSNFYVGNFFDSIARIGVPIFIMISGSLMLDKNYKYTNKKLINHISKMIRFLIFWSILYSVIYNIFIPIFIKHEPLDIVKFIESIIDGHFHLWFIYMIIGLYLIVPLLRLWVKDENKKYVEYFIVISVILSFIMPEIILIGSYYNTLFEHINIALSNINLKYVEGYTTYFILGWYLNNYNIKNKKLLYILGIISIIITFGSTAILSISKETAIQMYDNLTINVFFQSIMIFVIIKDKYKNIEYTNKKIISNISKNSLGIYAIHPLIITIVNKILINVGLDIAIINIPICFILVFIISFIISYLASKIPLLKRVV